HERVSGGSTRRLERPWKRGEVGGVGTVLQTERELLSFATKDVGRSRELQIARGGLSAEHATPADSGRQLPPRAFVRQLKATASGADFPDPRSAERDARRDTAEQASEIAQPAAERRWSAGRRTARQSSRSRRRARRRRRQRRRARGAPVLDDLLQGAVSKQVGTGYG